MASSLDRSMRVVACIWSTNPWPRADMRRIASEKVRASAPVGQGGLFCSLLRFTAPLGYDVLVPREVRLDAFLFGEEPGRYLVALEECQDDAFLLKMDDARLNCCFLGRTTKNRVVVDGYDFGPVSSFFS